MILDNITLSDFRQYQKKAFKFSPKISLVIGRNGSGKTNLLESIFLLATGKSFKADKDMEMIGFDKELARVNGKIKQYLSENHERNVLEVLITRGEVMGVKTPFKKYSVNGVGKRIIDFIGNLKCVLFWPEDLELVIGSPSLRRKYLDFVLIQTDREYRRTLISYDKGLRQRNRLLEAIRDSGAHRHQLMFWDQLLIKDGEYITKKRAEYIEFINKLQISEDKIQISNYSIVYDTSIISRLRLDQYASEEIAAGVTLVGPHRDDIIFNIKNDKKEWRNLSHFGSRGEQRLGILWLKLAELSYIETKTNDQPVLLLDDILSELDHEHRKVIFDIIGNQQTIITTTDIHFIEENILKNVEMIKLF